MEERDEEIYYYRKMKKLEEEKKLEKIDAYLSEYIKGFDLTAFTNSKVIQFEDCNWCIVSASKRDEEGYIEISMHGQVNYITNDGEKKKSLTIFIVGDAKVKEKEKNINIKDISFQEEKDSIESEIIELFD